MDLEGVRQAIAATMEKGRVPGIVLAVARSEGEVELIRYGVDAEGQALDVDSLLPVASVTKLATALAMLRIVDAGGAALDDPLAAHLPEAVAAQHGVTLRTLLSHTSGLALDLAAGAAPYDEALSWPVLAEACLLAPLDAAPMTRVQYSNVGYGLLGLIVERQTGMDFQRAVKTLALDPLGVEGYLGCEPPRRPAVLAEVRGAHAGTALEPYNSAFWRSLALPWGGLITTAAGALALVRAFQAASSGFLRPDTLTAATRDQAGGLPGGSVRPLIWPQCPWGLGPEIRGSKRPHWAPAEASPGSFGHAGQSGCLAWADPSRDVAWALLGARPADNGWLIRHATAVGSAVLAAAG